MAKMIDLDSFRKLPYYYNFETRSLNVLESMEGILALPLLIPSILILQLLMKIGPVLILFPTLIFL